MTLRMIRFAPLCFFVLLTTAFSMLSATGARAQVRHGAIRQNSISVFGAASLVNPDYGQDTNYGFLVGVDFTQHFRLADLSLEARYNRASGQVVSESSFAGGVKAEHAFGNFRPYADVLVGDGLIHFTHPADPNYTHDDSLIFTAGFGLDYDISTNFSVKVDAQAQTWKLGSETSRLTPSNLNFGVVYRLPFRGLRGRR